MAAVGVAFRGSQMPAGRLERAGFGPPVRPGRELITATLRRGPGAVAWIARVLAGLLLLSPAACASPGTVPAAGLESSAPSTAAAAPTPTVPAAAPLDQGTAPDAALAVLATLPVKGRAPKTGYSRDQFGQTWADVDGNGCDTRNDMLRRDLSAIALKPGTRDCIVLSGVLGDPYTATFINFLRGTSTSTAVQIDHVVALSDAWQKGAQQLSADQRLAFANDPLNLLAVDGRTNLQKSDGDAATWLPPNKAFRCSYVARQISVKSRYALWVTAAERDAMARVLGDCPEALAPEAAGTGSHGREKAPA